MNISTEKPCECDDSDDYGFYLMTPEIGDGTQGIILEIQHNKKCEACFYLEECVWRVEQILSRELWMNLGETIYENRTVQG